MKTVLLALALALSTYMTHAQGDLSLENAATTITITVPVQSSEGNIVYGLYTETNFMKQPTIGLTGEIVDGSSTVTFENIEPGTYAIILFHDKNRNKIMDFQPNGMPLEMYGVSNNVMNMGPPQWSDAKFEVSNEPITLDIRM